MVRRKGGDPYRGKHQWAYLRQAGFVKIQAGASYDSYGTEETTRQLGETMAAFMREENLIQQTGELGLAEPAELEQISQAWQEWGENPDAFTAHAYCEVVGWKE